MRVKKAALTILLYFANKFCSFFELAMPNGASHEKFLLQCHSIFLKVFPRAVD